MSSTWLFRADLKGLTCATEAEADTADADLIEAIIQQKVKTFGIPNMVKDHNSLSPPEHLMYSDAVEAMKLYHQAQADGVSGAELERLRLLAEHRFQAVTDYQLRALGGPSETRH